ESYCHAIGAICPVYIVSRFSTSAAWHIFRQYVWLPGDVLLEIRQERLQPHVSRSAWFLAANDGDCFSLIERHLGKNPTELEQEITEPNVSGNLCQDSELTLSCFILITSIPRYGFRVKSAAVARSSGWRIDAHLLFFLLKTGMNYDP